MTQPQQPARPATPPQTQTPTTPTIYMDPVSQRGILAQIGRVGWDAAQPQADVTIVNDPVNGPTPVVKGWKMVITDPKTNTNQTVDLSYSEGGKQPWGLVGAPETYPKDPNAPSKTAIGNDTTGYYVPDASGVYKMVVPPHTPNADDEVKKAVDRQDSEQVRNEKQANQDAGRGYQTNADYAKMASQATADKLSQAQLDEKVREFNATQGASNKQADAKQAAQDKVDAQQILQSQAQTGYIGAQTTGQQATTAATLSSTDIAQQEEPGKLLQQGATLAGTEASTAASQQAVATSKQAQQIAAAPTQVPTETTGLYQQVRNPLTGEVTSGGINPNFQPKTLADVAARTGQLQQMAQAQRDALVEQQQSGAITADQANQRFNDWWTQNVEPQKAALAAAQQTAQQEQQRLQQEQQRANYGTALQAGTNAVEAYKAELPNMVGPNFGNAFNQLAGAWASGSKVPSNIDWGSALTYQMPDLNQLSQQVTNQALAHLSPTAAQNMNDTHGLQAAPGTLQQASTSDYTQALQQSNYQPATTTIAPDGTVTINHTQPTTQAPSAPPAPAPAAYTPPGYGAGTAPTYPTVPWAGATPQPLSNPIATLQSLPNYQLTPS